MTGREQPSPPDRAPARSPVAGLPQVAPGVQSLPAPRKRPMVLGIVALAYLIWLIVLAWIAVLVGRGN